MLNSHYDLLTLNFTNLHITATPHHHILPSTIGCRCHLAIGSGDQMHINVRTNQITFAWGVKKAK